MQIEQSFMYEDTFGAFENNSDIDAPLFSSELNDSPNISLSFIERLDQDGSNWEYIHDLPVDVLPLLLAEENLLPNTQIKLENGEEKYDDCQPRLVVNVKNDSIQRSDKTFWTCNKWRNVELESPYFIQGIELQNWVKGNNKTSKKRPVVKQEQTEPKFQLITYLTDQVSL